MNIGSQFNLNSLIAGFNAMGGSVVQRDPVREDAMGIEALYQK